MLKILQCNLNRCHAAHDLAHQKALSEKFDLVVVGEPNVRKTEVGWFRDKRADVAVIFYNKNIEVDMVRKHQGFLQIRLKSFTLFCAYISPNARGRIFEDKLDNLFAVVRDTPGDKIVMGDLNCKAYEWGSPVEDAKGRRLCEWQTALDLVILNDGKLPTCVRPNGTSYVDITMATRKVARRIKGWTVETVENLSDHRYIRYEVEDKDLKPLRGKQTVMLNLIRCKILLRERFEDMQGQVSTPEACGKILREVQRQCTIYRRGRVGRAPYWWNPTIEECRNACTAARRVLTRAPRSRQTLEAIEGHKQRYLEAKRSLKREISRSKKAHWKKLCEDLQQDIWGDGYRIVVRQLKGLAPCTNLTPDRLATVVDYLFPARDDSWGQVEMTGEPALFSRAEVAAAVDGLKPGKAPGPDGIPAELVKVLWEVAPQFILELVNALLVRGMFPKMWKRARLTLIPKAGKNLEDPGAYRPISLIDAMAKLFETLIRDRLSAELEERSLISHCQFGFRKARSTLDAVQKVIEDTSRIAEVWCVFIALDVRNAFNSASWGVIMDKIKACGVSNYLVRLIGEYLTERIIITKHGDRKLTAGVPQGSVLGPTLWNLLYDGVLRLELPDGVDITAYADDLGVVVRACDIRTLNGRVSAALDQIDGWLTDNMLTLAPEKTEAVILKGPRKRDNIDIQIKGIAVPVRKALKYLGIWLDSQRTFGHHVVNIIKKTESRIGALGRIMPNIGGPNSAKRQLLLGVVHSTLLYGAPIWRGVLRIGRYKNMLISTQRKMLLRVASAYRTVSAKALQVVTGTPPIHMLVEERARTYDVPLDLRRDAQKRAREDMLVAWQEEWSGTNDVAQWTKRLIPNVAAWVTCSHRRIDYFTTQFLTGHGSFRAYTKRIGKQREDGCIYCGALDSVEHTIFVCARWDEFRVQLWGALGVLTPDNIVPRMLASPQCWKGITEGVKTIMRKKEEDERLHQRDGLVPP